MKKVVSIIVIMAITFLMLVYPVSANEEINVYLDGTKIEFDVYPQIIDGRTMVPIRAIFEEMGAAVNWDSQTSTAICAKDNTVVKMTVNSMNMYINDQLSHMDIAPCIVDGRTLAPARYVAEAFGADVQWDSQNNAVIINTKKVTLYAMDGRTIAVPENEVEAYLNVGWYRTLQETQQTMYAADGRTITVFKSEVSAYKNVGWYETRTEAEEANKPVVNPSVSEDSSNSNNPSADGNYYRTPTGKKYHLDPNCGGKNSYKTTNISGLGPCSKCAK